MFIVSLIAFILALGGMIFVHELGHYIASRWAQVDVEEFGFGFPPRAFGFWRNSGYLLLNGQRVEIPRNFDLSQDWSKLYQEPVVLTADRVQDKLILRSIEYMEVQEPEKSFNLKDIFVNNKDESQPEQPLTKQVVRLGNAQGVIRMEGELTEAHPGTLFSINWLPLGGFVRPKGENDPHIAGGLAAANPWKRLVVLFAGPLMNLLTASIVFSLLVALEGMPIRNAVKINAVLDGSPAQQANIKSGDILLSINGTKITEIQAAIDLIKANLDHPTQMVFDRNGEQVTITATPSSKRTNGALGVELGYPTRAATLSEVATGGVMITAVQAATLLYLPVALLQGVIAPKDARLVGFKGIFDMFNIAVKEDITTRQAAATTPVGAPAPDPTNMTLSLIGLLSVSLGVMNLLPIPALDGGRVLFTLPEILFKRRIPPERENIVNGVAMLLLIALMIFINVMDFINPVQIPPR